MKFLVFLAFIAIGIVSASLFTDDVIDEHFANTENEDKNLVDLASELGLTKLLEYATEAGLAKLLADGGPFTVFAPTDAAFEALPDHVKDKLKNPKVLKEVLLYHLFVGNFDSSMIKNELKIPSMLKGPKPKPLPELLGAKPPKPAPKGPVMIRFNLYKNNSVITATGSPISNADQMATNGIIHVIDRVMFPIPGGDIVDVVSHAKTFQTLLKAVKVADLVKPLKGDPLTLMAPTDEAFAKIPEEDLVQLLGNKTALTEVLTYHVVAATAFSAGLSDQQAVTTLEGQDFVITIEDGVVKVNDATVLFADAATSNGVIHAIDTVLIPPEK